MNVKRALIIGGLTSLIVGFLAIGIKTKPTQVKADNTYNTEFNIDNNITWTKTRSNLDITKETKWTYHNSYAINNNTTVLEIYKEARFNYQYKELYNLAIYKLSTVNTFNGACNFNNINILEGLESIDFSWDLDIFDNSTSRAYYNVNSIEHDQIGEEDYPFIQSDVDEWKIYCYEDININSLNLDNILVEDILENNPTLYDKVIEVDPNLNTYPITINNKQNLFLMTSTITTWNDDYWEDFPSYDANDYTGQIEDLAGYPNELEIEDQQNGKIKYINYNFTAKKIYFNQLIPEYTTEIVDLPGLMLQVLGMPFTFISQAFNLTIFEGTPYQINFSNLFKGLIAILTILFIIKLFTSGFSVIGNYTSSANKDAEKRGKIANDRKNIKEARKHAKETKKE